MPGPEPHVFSKIAESLVADLRGVSEEVPRKQRLRATKPLATVVEELAQKYQIGRAAPEDAIRDNWVAIVGPANASYSHPARLEKDGKVLIVLAAHAVVRNELFHHRDQIAERIRALPGCGGVGRIHLLAG